MFRSRSSGFSPYGGNRHEAVACGVMLSATAAMQLFVLSCERDYGLLPEEDYDSIETIVYSQHVQPLFNRKCATSGRHHAATAAGGLCDGLVGIHYARLGTRGHGDSVSSRTKAT